MLRILLSVILKCSNLIKYSVLAPINDQSIMYFTTLIFQQSVNMGKNVVSMTIPKVNKDACIWLLDKKKKKKIARMNIKDVEIAMII